MNTLQSFYKSKEWEKFRAIIISERTDDDGFVICAQCGKPIIHKYDLIVHHKTELTEGNVADVMVALNPDNVECVHFRCHNKLHDRWQGGNGGWRPAAKKVYIVYGAPCAGKSTWVSEVAAVGDLVVDLDSIWQCVSGLERYEKPEALKSVVFELRDKLYDLVKYRSGKWTNAFVITGGARSGDRERLMSRVGADELIFIDTAQDECLKRLEKRGLKGKKHDEWINFINEWFESYQE